MKNILFLIGICCLLNFEVKSQNKVDSSYTLDVVTEIPKFPGGMKALYELFSSKIKYPKIAEKYGAEGKVHIAFTILRTGELTDFRVLKSAYIPKENEDAKRKSAFEALDNEALRLMKLSPKWYPAKFKDLPVEIKTMIVPIQFILP